MMSWTASKSSRYVHGEALQPTIWGRFGTGESYRRDVNWVDAFIGFEHGFPCRARETSKR